MARAAAVRRSAVPGGVAETLLGGAGLLLALPLWTWWAVWKGGYPAAVFLPGIAYLALAVLLLHLWAPRPRLSGPLAVALAALAALVVWSLASLLWADDRGAAEIATARQALFLASFALPVLWPPGRTALCLGLAGFTAAAIVGGASAMAEALGDAGALLDGRLVGPTGYANASAALFAMAALPAVVAASRAEVGPVARTLALAAAAVLSGLFVLTQSRGGVVALAVVLAIAFLVLPGRLRLVVPIAIVAVAVLAILDPLLDVRRAAVDGGDVSAAIGDAALALGLLAAALVPVGLLYATVEARVELAPRVALIASRAAGVAVTAVAVGGAAILLASQPDVGGWVSDRADDFKTPDYSRLESQQTRFGGDLGSNRYDYWRASVEIFADRPLTGSGAGNFIAPYLEIRESEKSTLYAHSIWLRALAELGALGLLALAAFVGALALALWRSLRSRPLHGWLVVAGSLPLVYAVVQGSADWIGVFPVVTAPAVALAAAAASLGRAELAALSRGPRAASWWLAVGLALAALAALPLLAAARLADRGATTWELRPVAALRDLERAAELDPLAAAPQVRRGIVAIELRRHEVAERSFSAALDRDSSAWYPRFQLGLLAARSGSTAEAKRRLRAAADLNPGEPEIRRALRAIADAKAPDPRAAQRDVLARSVDE
jgi:tetratricopeptide (TPR) repeat protein